MSADIRAAVTRAKHLAGYAVLALSLPACAVVGLVVAGRVGGGG